jgi:hypothetical protein
MLTGASQEEMRAQVVAPTSMSVTLAHTPKSRMYPQFECVNKHQ